jgi:UDP-N-acetylglucosamine--N-acetylmuramyl-(pentapeptide) pyrophosphoryl-undecaprenol N-acetylglucosamine transferase
MSRRQSTNSVVVIACGGTGGHLFPGIALAEELQQRGGRAVLFVSQKEIDQQAVAAAPGVQVAVLPAVGLRKKAVFAFLRGFLRSYFASGRLFKQHRPDCVVAMGGFTSAPPVVAARRRRLPTFLHESNTIPGRANQWLSRRVNEAFVAFPSAGSRLRCRRVTVTGTPVRAALRSPDVGRCRAELGLDPAKETMLVMGGSQGASGINALVMKALPGLEERLPDHQWIHLAGEAELATVKAAYAALRLPVAVFAFARRMDLVLGAASVAVSRAGASTLAELAAVKLPAVLIPYPAATDDHQRQNARAFEALGAARLLEQHTATPQALVQAVSDLALNQNVRANAQRALADWHRPDAAAVIVEAVLEAISAGASSAKRGTADASAPIQHTPSLIA